MVFLVKEPKNERDSGVENRCKIKKEE